MALRLLTESGDNLIGEDVPGFSGVTPLNDTASLTIVKETFATNPTLDGWVLDTTWAWNPTNGNIESIPV